MKWVDMKKGTWAKYNVSVTIHEDVRTTDTRNTYTLKRLKPSKEKVRKWQETMCEVGYCRDVGAVSMDSWGVIALHVSMQIAAKDM